MRCLPQKLHDRGHDAYGKIKSKVRQDASVRFFIDRLRTGSLSAVCPFIEPESVKLYTHKQFRILDFISRIQVFAVY